MHCSSLFTDNGHPALPTIQMAFTLCCIFIPTPIQSHLVVKKNISNIISSKEHPKDWTLFSGSFEFCLSSHHRTKFCCLNAFILHKRILRWNIWDETFWMKHSFFQKRILTMPNEGETFLSSFKSQVASTEFRSCNTSLRIYSVLHCLDALASLAPTPVC